jgi:hypothetical protein
MYFLVSIVTLHFFILVSKASKSIELINRFTISL